METTDLIERCLNWLQHVQFMDYKFQVRESHGGVFMQASYMEPDTYTRDMETQLTRKWLLSPGMTESEVVQTAFKCCLTSMEHRTRESFLYQGARIFGPHFDVTDLVALCKDREDAGGRK
jgi:hypothetical protein